MITTERMEKALTYLAQTDEQFAYHKTHVAKTEYKAKQIKSAMFTRLSGTVAERQALAESSPEYQEAMESHFEALTVFEHMKNKRATEAIVIDTWRTIASAKKVGVDL